LLPYLLTFVLKQLGHFLSPITALEFLDLENLYLLAGEAQFLKIFDHAAGKLLHTEEIFDTQAVHGITCLGSQHDDTIAATLLIWGGRSIRLIEISVDSTEKPDNLVQLHSHTPEITADDWILDSCFRPLVEDGPKPDSSYEAVFVTTHNKLYALSLSFKLDTNARGLYSLTEIGNGPQSVLYSAHILWLCCGRILVAGGTVFGDVVLWSFFLDEDSDLPKNTEVHYRFAGHEGSVFGVRLSKYLSDGRYRRILASCSDDRTIRVWDVTNIENDNSTKTTSSCLATVMGHVSRIWALRFLESRSFKPQILSLGEDGTAQIWRLDLRINRDGYLESIGSLPFALIHDATYAYHSGKNIWAVASSERANGASLISTGGADGRIVSYRHCLDPSKSADGVNIAQYTMKEALKSAPVTNKDPFPVPDSSRSARTVKRIFTAMRGEWKISRGIRSAISTYPSGAFHGLATLIERAATDKAYDDESLYSERGEFATEQGLKIKASRQYVYRYQNHADEISAWFVKPDDGTSVDYLFHDLGFGSEGLGVLPETQHVDPHTITAKGGHLCIDDYYTANYSFYFDRGILDRWSVKYTVKGPNKDYRADAEYTRHQQPPIAKPIEKETDIREVQRANTGRPRKSKGDAFKTYVWVSENDFLTTTEQGHVILGSLEPRTESKPFLKVLEANRAMPVHWEVVGHADGLQSSSRATSVISVGIALLMGSTGGMFLYQHDGRRFEDLGRLYHGAVKPAYLYADLLHLSWRSWLDHSTGPVSPNEQNVIGCITTDFDHTTCDTFVLYPEKSNWKHSRDGNSKLQAWQPEDVITSACFIQDKKRIVIGCRNGMIVISSRLVGGQDAGSTEAIEPVRCKAHGDDAVTVIQEVPIKKHEATEFTFYLLTVGRDGVSKIHLVDVSGKVTEVTCVHSVTPPFGPCIEGASFSPKTHELFLWGFRSKQSVVWNESQKMEVMAVDCGGAHRNWAYQPLGDGKGGGSFVWTKASVCNIHSQAEASHRVLQSGGHGREIKAMAISPPISLENGSSSCFIATGAEDTAIRFFRAKQNIGFSCSTILTQHTTGIQKLKWSLDGKYLFSAAGCEEFFVWRVQAVPFVGIGAVCKGRCPQVSESKYLRIMDFTIEESASSTRTDSEISFIISMAYSDSSFRVYQYHAPTSEGAFLLIAHGSYTSHCLTQTTFLRLGTQTKLCTASTDGHLAIWHLPSDIPGDLPGNVPQKIDSSASLKTNFPITNFEEVSPSLLSQTTRVSIHQNSIKSLLSMRIPLQGNDEAVLIVTASDDQAIALTILIASSHCQLSTDRSTNLDPESKLRHATLLIPNAHASAVTSLAHLSTTYNSSLNDASIFHFASVGSDQRLKIWQVNVDCPFLFRSEDGSEINMDSVVVEMRRDAYTSVNDASSLESFPDADRQDEEHDSEGAKGGWKLLVAGIGMEMWKIEHAPHERANDKQ